MMWCVYCFGCAGAHLHVLTCAYVCACAGRVCWVQRVWARSAWVCVGVYTLASVPPSRQSWSPRCIPGARKRVLPRLPLLGLIPEGRRRSGEAHGLQRGLGGGQDAESAVLVSFPGTKNLLFPLLPRTRRAELGRVLPGCTSGETEAQGGHELRPNQRASERHRGHKDSWLRALQLLPFQPPPPRGPSPSGCTGTK